MHENKHIIQKTACTNCLLDDKPMRFKTCRRHQKSNSSNHL